jgi:hypothetical protein
MLKKSSSFVLARHSRLTISAAFTSVPRFIQRGVKLRGSTYGTEYASPLRSLRPCWTAFLTILQEIVIRFETFHGCVLSPRK